MRIAWQGALGAGDGGVNYAALQVIQGLRHKGAKLDCYVAGPVSDVPAILRGDPGIGVVNRAPRWAWDRWYSRNPLSAFVTGQSARGFAQLRLARLLAREHARRPYDVLYQFSQIELFGIRSLRSALPPIVLHPEVHAAGELTWHRRENHLAARGEPALRRSAARAVLAARTIRQRRDIALARRVIAPSHIFASHLAADYGFPRDHISVVPNPIDLERFAPSPARSVNRDGASVTVLFVSRLAVRKGVELVTALSHRLADLEGDVRIEVIGDRSLWSDYRALMADLNPAIASYEGSLDNARLADAYRAADLVIQPSHYEPFALTVGEALASGVPVVASSEVGATEGVSPECCAVFPAGDLNGFEGAVRGLVGRIRKGEGPALARLARADAQRLFSVEGVSDGIVDSLEAAIRDGHCR
jgi:glycosyltransferase involved in cell wall biosynthesis